MEARRGDGSGRQIGTYDELDPEKAALIQEACERVIAGDSLLAVVKDWNKRGVTRGADKPWTRQALREMLLRPRIAGLRQYKGEVIGAAAWEGAVSPELWERVTAILTNPLRQNKPGPRVENLLSGIARCGLCGSSMSSVLRKTRKASQRALVCTGCQRVARKQSAVEVYVENIVLELLSTAKPEELFARKGSDPELARKTLETLRARKDEAASLFASGDIDGAQLKAINEQLAPGLSDAEAAYAEAVAEPDLMDLAGPDIADRWGSISWERRRRAVDRLFAVKIYPTTFQGYYRRQFDSTTVDVKPKN